MNGYTENARPDRTNCGDAPLKVLVVTSLFPRPASPLNGIFNYQSISAISNAADLSVLCPVSWIDAVRDGIERNNDPAPALTHNNINAGALGFSVEYTRFFSIPVFGRGLNGFFEFRSLLRPARRIHGKSHCDIILCYWVYPDGQAARFLARDLGIPYVLVALGSDLNIMSGNLTTRKHIARTVREAAAIISVSESLSVKAASLGADPGRCFTIPNGVNKKIFRLLSGEKCRKELGIDAGSKIILFIGTMDPIKGLDVMLEAVASLEGEQRPTALLVGEGASRKKFEKRARSLGIADNCKFLGSVTHSELPVYMNAADVLCLPSRNEGCPNVILEAHACGLPVIASRTGGIPELITEGKTGIMVEKENPPALKEAILSFFASNWNRAEIARSNERSWNEVARETLDVLARVVSKH